MRSPKLMIAENGKKVCKRLFMISMASLIFIACKKDTVTPQSDIPIHAPQLHLSTSRLVLLEGNSGNTAITFDWTSCTDEPNATVTYTIESAISGSQFADAVEIGSTNQLSAGFTVKEFNLQMRKLIIPGSNSRVEFRIRTNKSYSKEGIFSNAIALEVTPYQPYIEYDNKLVIRIPGNYQNWILPSAPKVISPQNTGEYEGYINFTNPLSQFLMVKGSTEWDPKVTYDYIGANKLGFGGSVFSIFGGAGIYKFNVNTNTNTWSYTRINSWGLNGSAISNNMNAEAVMIFDATTLTWSITTNLVQGDFRFRANNSNDINFGHNSSSEIGTPTYNGESIHITKPGNYTIKLDLTLAGNYAYGIQKNS